LLAEKKKKKEKKEKKNVGEEQVTEDFQIAPEKTTPTLDCSKWPLLLKVNATQMKC
jgi:hypothetical protein